MSEVTIINVVNLFVSSEPQPVAPQSYEDIRQVFSDALGERAVRFIYVPDGVESGEAVPQLRTLTPTKIVTNLFGDESVVGHDHDRDYARRFRLDRVEQVVVAEDVEPYRG